jgi:hypothetical protein
MPNVTTGDAARLADVVDRTECLGRRLAEIRTHVAALEAEPLPRADVERALHNFDGLWQQMTPREQEKLQETGHDHRGLPRRCTDHPQVIAVKAAIDALDAAFQDGTAPNS